MLIDWFTVVAQVVNFLVLVWLLKHFLYKRVISAMDARENRIATRMREAETSQERASERLQLYEAKLRELDQQRESMLADAKADAEKLHTQMLEAARERVRVLETTWRGELDRDREHFLLDLRRRAAGEVIAIARRVIGDLASADLQHSAVQVFLDRIRSLDHEALTCFADGEVQVRSALEMSDDDRGQILDALEQRLHKPLTLHFVPAPELGLGVELRGNGWRIGWNSEGYLDVLEEDMKQVLEDDAAAAAAAT